MLLSNNRYGNERQLISKLIKEEYCAMRSNQSSRITQSFTFSVAQ